MLSPSFIEALVVAVLAVGQFPQQRVRDAIPALRTAGILDPPAVSKMDLGELTVILARNGYHRGLLTSMYGERVQALMQAIQSGSLDGLVSHVAEGNRANFEKALQEVFGVGPKVAANAWKLLTSDT